MKLPKTDIPRGDIILIITVAIAGLSLAILADIYAK